MKTSHICLGEDISHPSVEDITHLSGKDSTVQSSTPIPPPSTVSASVAKSLSSARGSLSGHLAVVQDALAVLDGTVRTVRHAPGQPGEDEGAVVQLFNLLVLVAQTSAGATLPGRGPV